MQFIAMILFLAYNATCLLYFKRHFPTKQENWIYYVAVMALNLICYITMDLLNHHQIGVLVILASFILELKLLFKMDLLQILYGGGIYILIIYCSKGIIISIFSLLLHESVNSVLQQKFYYYIISIIAGILAIGFIQLMKKTIAADEKIKCLFRNTSQMKFIVIYQFAILIYNLLISDGCFLNISFSVNILFV